MKHTFELNGIQYSFNCFEEKGSENGIFLVEVFDTFLNHYTPRYFIVCYKERKVSFKAENAMDFDIKSAIVKTIIRWYASAS
ncbi:hypothetical protein ACTHGU_19950 [Chitinophagaceae bacterium MMS25-I14]